LHVVVVASAAASMLHRCRTTPDRSAKDTASNDRWGS
jgi:hypothetical protein